MFILPESLHLKVKNATEDDGVEDSSPDSLSTATSTECDQTVQSAAPLPRRIFEMLKVMLAPLQLFIPGRLEMIEDSSVVKLPSRYSLILLVISRALLEMASNGVDSLMIPYTNVEFNWVHDMDAIFIAFTGFTSLVVFVAIFPVCQKLYKKFIIKLGRTKSVALSFSTGSDDDENEDTWEGGPEDSDGFSSSELLGDRSSGSTPRNSPEAKEDQNRHFEIDYHFYLMGILVTTVGFMLVPIYRTEAVYFTGAALSVLGSVANVTFMSMITAVVPAQWTSKLLGGVTVAVTVAVSIGLVLYGWVFAQTAATWPSFYFCIATLTTVVSFIVGSSALMWLPRQLVSSPMLV
ncbi:hypothetical protein BGZ73_002523 [Actinomortierella ambigua]|nr:hypothetical protein BGZ73_002523 [Actinomortierella ambigua]